jgi:hypothetical protein
MESVSSMKARLARLEARLQTLIEGSAARFFPFNATPSELAPHMITALRSGSKTRSDGRRIAPNLFTLSVHPGQEDALQSDPVLLQSLARILVETGEEEGLTFLDPPVLRIVSDSKIPPQGIHVAARINLVQIDETTDLEVGPEANGTSIPDNAFLIVNGTEVFPLVQSVVNIGRRQDNQLVIDDPRVSRVHAQLRAIKGRFTIFDLDSTGGTFVNDQRVVQGTLYPGDVISLAGVPLVFGQDTSGYGETQKFDQG